MADDRNKYIKMENVLNTINRKYISMSDEEIKRNNQILKAIVELIVNKMKHKDVLFKTMFSNIFYGGSFYDGLRVGNPEEFDLDLLLNLPKLVAPSVTTSNVPGFVHLQLTKYADLLKQKSQAEKYRYFKPANTQMHNNFPEYRNDNHNYYYQRQETEQNYYTTTSIKEHTENYYLRRRRKNQRRNARRREFFNTHGGLDKLMDDQYYLVTNKVLRWMEGVVTKALNELDKNGPPYLLCIPQGNLYARICKGGPAFTLKVEGDIQGKRVNMDIDLVPCFVFGPEKWPQNGFKKNPVAKKPNFFIVPKPLKISVGKSERYWRLSFQEQERELIDGKRTLKPTIKLLKMLKDYHAFIESHAIPYFWYKHCNLIGNTRSDTIMNTAHSLERIINKIEMNPHDEFIAARYILSRREYDNLVIPENANYIDQAYEEGSFVDGEYVPGHLVPNSSCTLL